MRCIFAGDTEERRKTCGSNLLQPDKANARDSKSLMQLGSEGRREDSLNDIRLRTKIYEDAPRNSPLNDWQAHRRLALPARGRFHQDVDNLVQPAGPLGFFDCGCEPFTRSAAFRAETARSASADAQFTHAITAKHVFTHGTFQLGGDAGMMATALRTIWHEIRLRSGPSDLQRRNRNTDRRLSHDHFHIAQAQRLPSENFRFFHAGVFDKGAVAGTEIAHKHGIFRQPHFAMLSRNRRMGHEKVILTFPPEPIATRREKYFWRQFRKRGIFNQQSCHSARVERRRMSVPAITACHYDGKTTLMLQKTFSEWSWVRCVDVNHRLETVSEIFFQNE